MSERELFEKLTREQIESWRNNFNRMDDEARIECNILCDMATRALSACPDGSTEMDARRYRWLRDQSVPPHNFYLSVPVEFADYRYTPGQVDDAIDAAIAALSRTGAVK